MSDAQPSGVSVSWAGTCDVRLGHALLVVLTSCVAGTAGPVALLLALRAIRLSDVPSEVAGNGGTIGLVLGIGVALVYLIYHAEFPSRAPLWKHYLRPSLTAMILGAGYTWWWLSVLASV